MANPYYRAEAVELVQWMKEVGEFSGDPEIVVDAFYDAHPPATMFDRQLVDPGAVRRHLGLPPVGSSETH